MGIIRKISVGPDYKNAMHYIVGQDVLNNSHFIHLIRLNPEMMTYETWIESDKGEVVLWKETPTAHASIEYDINF